MHPIVELCAKVCDELAKYHGIYEHDNDKLGRYLEKRKHGFLQDGASKCAAAIRAIPQSEVDKAGEAVAVAGEYMEWSLADYTNRANILIRAEQEKLLPDNYLISFLCNSVRLARENQRLATEPYNAAPAALPKEGEA